MPKKERKELKPETLRIMRINGIKPRVTKVKLPKSLERIKRKNIAKKPTKPTPKRRVVKEKTRA